MTFLRALVQSEYKWFQLEFDFDLLILFSALLNISLSTSPSDWQKNKFQQNGNLCLKSLNNKLLQIHQSKKKLLIWVNGISFFNSYLICWGLFMDVISTTSTIKLYVEHKFENCLLILFSVLISITALILPFHQ